MKNLLKFISIGLVLMVVVFSQMTDSSVKVEAADVAENDIDFMQDGSETGGVAGTVVKYYKASSSDTPVSIYVRDKDLNTTFTGETTWISASGSLDRVVHADSTWTLDLGLSAKTIVAASLKEQKVKTLTCTTGCGNTAGRLDAAKADAAVSATSGSGNIASLKIDITMDGNGAVTAQVPDTNGGFEGLGFQVDDTVTVDKDTIEKGGETNPDDAVFTVTEVTAVNGTTGNFTKAEDSDNGVTSGPNLYMGSNTPLKLNTLTVKKGTSTLNRDDLDESAGTFSLSSATVVGDTIASDGVKASYSFSAQDIYTGLAAGAKRVHVTSSSDSTGEWLEIKEVDDEGAKNGNYTNGILTVDTVGAADTDRTAGTYSVNPGDYTYQGTGVGAAFTVVVDSVGAATVTVRDGLNGAGYAIDNTITVDDANLGDGGGANLTFDVATRQATGVAATDTGIFRGQFNINTDASAGAADNGSVWVQDGDTLTASFYAAKNSTDNTTGALIASTTATIDATAPTISDVSPIDGTLTKDTTPSLEFTIEDGGSGFDKSVSNFADHVTVSVNGCDIPSTALGVKSHSTSAITVSYNAAVDWTGVATKTAGGAADIANCITAEGNDATHVRTGGGFNVTSTGAAVALTSSTVHGTKFSWYIKATDDAGNEKELGDNVHDWTGITTSELDIRVDTKAPAATGVAGAKAWSSSEKKDVTDNSSVKITFDESLDANTVTASDFTVSGVGVTSSSIETVTMGGDGALTDTLVYLDLAADLGPNAKPKVKLVGEVTDRAGNALKPATSETTGKTLGTSTDSVKPTLSEGAVTEGLIAKDGKTTFTYTSNENLTKTSGTFNADRGTYGSISGGGKTSGTAGVIALDETDAGKVSITLSNPTSGKGTVKHKTAHNDVPMTKTGIYGIASVGRDAADNVGVGGITKVIEDVSSQFDTAFTTVGAVAAGDTQDIKLKNWPLADHDGDGSLKDSIVKITVGGSVPNTLQYIDAARPDGTGQGGFRTGTGTVATASLAALDPADANADDTYTITTTNAQSTTGDGSGAIVTITTTDGGRTLDSIVGGGGYAVNDVITIDDDLLGDTAKNQTDPAVITINTVNAAGTPTAASAVTTYISQIDWSENELITLKSDDASEVNITAAQTVKITYYYVNAESTVELDLDAPTVTFTPTDLTSTTDKTPSISFAWDDDEYAGDNYTTVVMTKAELLDPDGATLDILADLTTTDDKTFYYRPEGDLANGEFKLTVSAEDTAGNEQKDQTSKFTVKDRTKTTVAMEPGWNLVSIPADAADSAINTVITNTQVETVLTYDPSTPGGWLTAVRDGDALVGTLSTIEPTHGYWIFQKNGDDIKVDLPGYKGGASATPPVISIVAGWNLIPVVSLTVGNETVPAGVDKDGYLWGIDWVKAKGWDATNEEWDDVVPDTAAAPDITNGTELKIGKGYWLYSNEAGVIVP